MHAYNLRNRLGSGKWLYLAFVLTANMVMWRGIRARRHRIF